MNKRLGYAPCWLGAAIIGMSLVGTTFAADDQPTVTFQDAATHQQRVAESAKTVDYGMLPSHTARKWVDRATKFAASTYPLTQSGKATGKNEQDVNLIYDPAKIWHAEKEGKATGPSFLTGTPTDSAASASALGSGFKTYNSSINKSDASTDQRSFDFVAIPQLAKQYGKITGTVTTVPLSHATPAGLGGAHNLSRGNYAEIANEMYTRGTLDLVFGAGHPMYDDSSRDITDPEKRNYNYVGGKETWELLKSGKHSNGWKLIETKADFEKLADGSLLMDEAFAHVTKLTGVPFVASTLQQGRTGARGVQTDAEVPAPYAVPMNTNVPDETTMIIGALNFLQKRSKESGNVGFYVMLEGGAVDWAAHANQKPRIVEEIQAHQKATVAVLEWLEKNDLLKETLVISTADHETGLVWGPESDKFAFDPIRDVNGDGVADFRFNSGGHSNSLVPFWVWGGNEVLFQGLTIKTDPEMGALYGPEYTRYLDNTDVFRLSSRAITDSRSGIRNVIVLIGDGMGLNAIGASNSVK